jgi:hypothetical protein
MASYVRKRELLVLLGNCVIVIALTDRDSDLVLAQDLYSRHIAELDRDYPGWREELE